MGLDVRVSLDLLCCHSILVLHRRRPTDLVLRAVIDHVEVSRLSSSLTGTLATQEVVEPVAGRQEDIKPDKEVVVNYLLLSATALY